MIVGNIPKICQGTRIICLLCCKTSPARFDTSHEGVDSGSGSWVLIFSSIICQPSEYFLIGALHAQLVYCVWTQELPPLLHDKGLWVQLSCTFAQTSTSKSQSPNKGSLSSLQTTRLSGYPWPKVPTPKFEVLTASRSDYSLCECPT